MRNPRPAHGLLPEDAYALAAARRWARPTSRPLRELEHPTIVEHHVVEPTAGSRKPFRLVAFAHHEPTGRMKEGS